MKDKDFWNREQAQSYLGGSVVRYKSDPIYIYEVTHTRAGKYTAHFLPLGITDREFIHADVSELDLNPVPLGLVNFREYGRNFCVSTYRKPLRQWKIGLSRNNMIIRPGQFDKNDFRDSLLQGKDLRKTILNEFPSYEEALHKVVDEGEEGMAFSRRFAVKKKTKHSYLFHNLHENSVGKIIDRDIRLDDKYQYLSESLEEDLR